MQLIFLRKSDCLGCTVLLCLVVCLFDLACFFLPSFSSLIKTCTRKAEQTSNLTQSCMCILVPKYTHVHVYACIHVHVRADDSSLMMAQT